MDTFKVKEFTEMCTENISVQIHNESSDCRGIYFKFGITFLFYFLLEITAFISTEFNLICKFFYGDE